ncbi:MAG TPA: choice-of-anchor tandem repeat GloVer-containing protein, partial [Stenomitos sp.]
MSLQYWTAGLLLPLTLALTALQLPLASTVGALKGPSGQSAVAPSSLDVPFQQKRPSRSRAGVGQAAAGVKLTTLHTFIGTDNDKKDGEQPFAGLALDATGNLFGTTFEGGRFYKKTNLGTVFQLSPSRPLTILRSFNDEQGANPTGKVAVDSNKQLFGTTYQGGKHGKGTLFKLSARPSGSISQQTVLHNFQSTDGT